MDTLGVLKEMDKLTDLALDKILNQDVAGGMELIYKKDEMLVDLMNYIKANPDEYDYIVIPPFYELEVELQNIWECLLNKYNEKLSTQENAEVRACNDVSRIRNYIYVCASIYTQSEIVECEVVQDSHSKRYILTGASGDSVMVKINRINKLGTPWYFIPKVVKVEP